MKVTIETPIAMDDPSKVRSEEIPLPPQEMWAELENSPGRAAATSSSATAQPQTPRSPTAEVESLDFVGTDHLRTIPLSHPFMRAGKVIDTITVRRLPVGTIGDLIEALPADRTDNFEIYAAMTGLPAPVLRGLIDVDGVQVAGACFDFLPRAFRPAAAS